MSLKTSLVLAVVFIGLGSLAIFDPLSLKKKRNEREQRQSTIFWLKDKKLSSLEIRRGSLEPVQLLCQARDGCPLDSQGEWKLEKPVDDLADNNNIGSFLTSLETLAAVDRLRFPAEPPVLSEFGLEGAAMELRFTESGNTQPKWLKLGSKATVGSNYYAQSSESGQDILLVASYFFDSLNKEIVHWRNKRVFPGARTEDISSLAWDGHEFQQKEGVWNLVRPIQAKANSGILNGLAGSLAFLSAETIVERAKVTGKPELQIKFKLKDKNESVELISAKEKGNQKLFARTTSQNWVAQVDPNLLTRFKRKLSDLRDKQLVSEQDRQSLAELEFFFPREKEMARFKKSGQEWVQSGGTPVKLSQDRLRRFVELLGTNQVQAFAKNKEVLQRPDVVLKLIANDGKVLMELPFAILQKTRIYTQGELPGETRMLTGEFLHTLPARLVDLDIDHNKVVNAPGGNETEGGKDGHGHSHE